MSLTRQLTLLILASSLAWAESGITGTVTDATGAAVPGVAIQVIHEASGAAVPTRSNAAGVYRVAPLAPGSYRLEAELAGFEKLVRQGVVVTVGQVVAVDLAIQVGAASQTINVEAPPALTETQSASVGQLVNSRMVSGLPMPNRAATALVALAPGVVLIDSGSGAENYPLFSVAGGRARNQDFTLDGGSINNAVGLTRPQQMTSLPMDAMQEFRVVANNYAAEYGHSTGGVITLSTRAGTNNWHGSAFEYARNEALDARNFFAASKPPLKMHQFGGTLGGPLHKDKTHFFASWEETRQVSSVTVIQTVPNAAQRAGDFSGQAAIYDPATTVGHDRQPFADNRIPASRFDPVARAALAYWPLANRAATSTGANNFAGTNPSNLSRDILVGRLDHQFRSSDQLTARYYINNSSIANHGSYGIPSSDPDAGTNDVRVQSILGGYTHIFGPSLVNEAKFSFLQRKYIAQRYGFSESLGLTGVNTAVFPTFTLPGYASLGGEGGRFQTPIRDTDLQDAVSWYRGKHAFKFGAQHRRGHNVEHRDRSSAGNFAITPLITGKPDLSASGDALASFLLGEVNAAAVLSSDVISSRAYYFAGYAQDDWRITEKLTLNYGLRWEVELPRRVDGNRMNSFDPYALNPVSGTPGVVTFAGLAGAPRQAFRTDWNNFGPRMGIAWHALSHTVLRAGAGIFYGPTVSNTIGDAASLGFATSASLITAQPDISSAMLLRDGFPAFTRPPLGPGFGAAAPGQKPYTAVTFFDPHRPVPVSYQYNFNVQQELGQDTVVEAGYIGNVSHRLTADDFSINQVPPQLMGAGNSQLLRPFPQFSNVSVINAGIGNSTYHGGYLKAERRFRGGFSFLAHYTFSKFLDDVNSSVEYGDAASYMDAYHRFLDKGRSGSDVPQRFVASGLYELRAIRGHRVLNAAVGGWNLGVLGTWQSGEPYTVVTLANTSNAFPAGPPRADLVNGVFRAPQPYRFGNAPRNGSRGGPLHTVDLTAAKQFPITERYRADLRAELYNALNQASFDAPGHVLGAANFGVVSGARPARTVQVGLRLSF